VGTKLTPGQVAGAVKRSAVLVRDAIRIGAIRGAERGRSFIVTRTPADQGQLRASWKVRQGIATAIQRGTAMLAELINDAPHAGIVERGARPHTVSPEGWMAIYDWVIRHRVELGLVTESGNARRPKKSKAPLAAAAGIPGGGVGLDPEAARITGGIVWKLRTRGQAPTYFVKDNLAALRFILDTEVRNSVDAALRRARDQGAR
jgi:hypothetical protein